MREREEKTGERKGTPPQMTASEIVKAYGYSLNDYNLIFLNPYVNRSENSRLTVFFDLTGVDPNSNFGQFVILRINEMVAHTHRERTSKRERTPGAVSRLSRLQKLEETLRTVRQTIGKLVFKEDAEKQGNEVVRRITRGPVTDVGGRGNLARRQKWYSEFTDPLRKNYPLADLPGRRKM